MAVTKQPAKNNLRLVDELDTRGWTTGLFGCFSDISDFLFACCCLGCYACRVTSRMDECLIMSLLDFSTVIAMRTKLRIMGGIKGSLLGDCLAVTFCCPCVMCQLSREMDAMEM